MTLMLQVDVRRIAQTDRWIESPEHCLKPQAWLLYWRIHPVERWQQPAVRYDMCDQMEVDARTEVGQSL